MMRSISSMSATIPWRVAAIRARELEPSRSRASGVRRSCDTPASSSARSCSICRRFASIALKPRLTAAISEGPRLGQRLRRLAATDAGDRGFELAQRRAR